MIKEKRCFSSYNKSLIQKHWDSNEVKEERAHINLRSQHQIWAQLDLLRQLKRCRCCRSRRNQDHQGKKDCLKRNSFILLLMPKSILIGYTKLNNIYFEQLLDVYCKFIQNRRAWPQCLSIWGLIVVKWKSLEFTAIHHFKNWNHYL